MRGFPGSPVVKTELLLLGRWVQSLVRELISHMLHLMAKRQTNKRQKTSQVSTEERQITLENLWTAISSGQLRGSQWGATMGVPPPLPQPGDTEQCLDVYGRHDSGRWRPGQQINILGHPAEHHSRECSGPKRPECPGWGPVAR